MSISDDQGGTPPGAARGRSAKRICEVLRNRVAVDREGGTLMNDLRDLLDLKGKCAIHQRLARARTSDRRSFRRVGASLFLAFRKSTKLDRVPQLSGPAIRDYAVAADLGACDGAQALANAAVELLGHVDILVNNAGASWERPQRVRGFPRRLEPGHGSQDHRPVSADAGGGARELSPRRTGAILNIASIEGLTGHQPDLPGTIAI